MPRCLGPIHIIVENWHFTSFLFITHPERIEAHHAVQAGRNIYNSFSYHHDKQMEIDPVVSKGKAVLETSHFPLN